MAARIRVQRQTRETEVELELELDGRGEAAISTGIPFLDHMLHLFAAHGYFNLKIKAQGDLEVDQHHTVEDLGICLGQAFRQALQARPQVRRYGEARVPMDEALAQVTLDLSNRPYLRFQVQFPPGGAALDPQLVQEFWRAFAVHGGITLHIQVPYGENTHHIMEAIFKAAGRALDLATQIEPRAKGVPSTKGVLYPHLSYPNKILAFLTANAGKLFKVSEIRKALNTRKTMDSHILQTCRNLVRQGAIKQEKKGAIHFFRA
jgi:imidazoleglycerol-phosphate dehydratase